jgi:chromosomal replication initiation ATPase DnaA
VDNCPNCGYCPPHQLTRITDIVDWVSSAFVVSPADIMGESREAKICRARFAVYYLASVVHNRGQSVVARVMNRDHTTISAGICRARSLLLSDDDFRVLVEALKK